MTCTTEVMEVFPGLYFKIHRQEGCNLRLKEQEFMDLEGLPQNASFNTLQNHEGMWQICCWAGSQMPGRNDGQLSAKAKCLNYPVRCKGNNKELKGSECDG